jgi:hypothetical protein
MKIRLCTASQGEINRALHYWPCVFVTQDPSLLILQFPHTLPQDKTSIRISCNSVSIISWWASSWLLHWIVYYEIIKYLQVFSLTCYSCREIK